LSGQRDILFGVAFSGRPTDLAGADSIVGPFATNLPVRMKLAANETLTDRLMATNDHLLRLNQYQFVSASQIQAWSDVPWRFRLYDSLVVVQNYLVHESARRVGRDVAIDGLEGPIHTNFPLLVLVEPETSWRVTLIYDSRLLAGSAAERWMRDLIRVIECMAEDSSATVDVVLASLSPPVVVERACRPSIAPSQNYVPPRTPTQQAIARVWEKVIRLDQVSIEDNLFDLGVHSLLVVQLVHLLEEQLGSPIGLVNLFRYPTILSLAQFLDSGSQEPSRLIQIRDRGQRQRDRFAAMKNVRSRIKR
jgi:non-ribosomal peptide synthetase component F